MERRILAPAIRVYAERARGAPVDNAARLRLGVVMRSVAVASTWFAAAFSLPLLWPAPLSGQTANSELILNWHVVEGCPDRDVAKRTIADFLAQRGARTLPRATVTITITHEADGRFLAEVSAQDAAGSGERRFHGQSCARVAEAAALIAAMALEAARVGDVESPNEVPPPIRLATSPVAPASAAARSSVRLAVGAVVSGDLGSLPKPSLGAGVVFGAKFGRVDTQLDAMAWLPRLATYGERQVSGGEIGLFAATLRGCYDVLTASHASIGFGPCLGVEGGLSIGHGVRRDEALRESFQDQGFWGAALAGMALRQRRPEAGLVPWVSLELGVPFSRPVYELEQDGQRFLLFQAAAVVVRVSFGTAWTFL